MPKRMVSVSAELLIKADSCLSLLWYRPSTIRDVELTMEVQEVIGGLRDAYTRNPDEPMQLELPFGEPDAS